MPDAWRKPQKPRLPVRQLLILSICRFAEPIVLTSILPYLPEMIEYVGVRKNEVAKWVGVTSAVAAGCQALMAVPWGTASDYVGRKPVILLCLTFTMVLSIVFGMSQSLPMLLFSRGLLGFLNGNVGIIRTMVAEMVPERELQPRAFSIMPLVWTMGSIFGPAFGGALARPVEKHPYLFGGSAFLKKYPFALPNLAAACFFVVGITTGFLFLRETLETRQDRRDYGLMLGKALTRPCTLRKYDSKPDWAIADAEQTALLQGNPCKPRRPVPRPAWRQVFTPQSNLVLLAYTLMAMHSMAFDAVFPVFLHYPEQDFHNNPDVKLPFKFVGGFGVDAQAIGLYYTLTGITGMIIQFLFFPPAAKRYGVLTCLKVSALIFPIVFFATPFTVLLPEFLRKPAVFLLMFVKLGASIFGFPCCTILLTNSASSLNVLGTLNGVATSVSSIGRAAGPALMGTVFSVGVQSGYVIIPWWMLGALAIVSALPIFWIVETDGLARDERDESDDENESDSEDAEENGYGAVASPTSSGGRRAAA